MNRVSDSSLKQQVLSTMRLKTDEELIDIWQKNDRSEWTDSAFEVVKEVLLERHVALPQQNAPIQLEEIDSTSPADELLHSFQAKNNLSNLIELVWLICLFQVFILIAGGVFWVSSLLSHTRFHFLNMWFPITGTILAIPIYFLRKRVKNEVSQMNQKLAGIIGKGLE